MWVSQGPQKYKSRSCESLRLRTGTGLPLSHSIGWKSCKPGDSRGGSYKECKYPEVYFIGWHRLLQATATHSHTVKSEMGDAAGTNKLPISVTSPNKGLLLSHIHILHKLVGCLAPCSHSGSQAEGRSTILRWHHRGHKTSLCHSHSGQKGSRLSLDLSSKETNVASSHFVG